MLRAILVRYLVKTGSVLRRTPFKAPFHERLFGACARVDEIKNGVWVKFIFLTGFRLNAKWQHLLPPTLPEKNRFASIASKLHHLRIQGQRSGVRLKLSRPIFIHYKLRHNEVVILPQVYKDKAWSVVILFTGFSEPSVEALERP